MFDITKLAVNDTAAIHLKGPDGEYLYADAAKEKKIRIVIYGPGSKPFAAVESLQTQRAVKRMQDNDGKVSVAPADQRSREQAEDLAAITVAIENFEYPPAKGKEGVALFEALYADPTLGFIPPQILKAVRDWGNFKPGSATN